MTPNLSGVLHLRPISGGEGLLLNLTPQPADEDGCLVRTRMVKQGAAQEATLELAATAFGASLAGRPVRVTLAVEDEVVLQQIVVPAARGDVITAGPIVLPADAFDDRAGAVGLEVAVSNGFGVTVTLFAERFSLELADTEDGRRLARMLQRVLAATPKLMPPDAAAGMQDAASGSGEADAASTSSFWDRVERVASAYAELHRFFEKSARFRLQQGLRLTTLARVSSVTHRTLEFIATHPEELQPTDRASGIAFGRRHWLPARTVDETHQKSFDIYENRCLVAFLQTVLDVAQNALKTLERLAALDGTEVFATALAPVWAEKGALIPLLQGLSAAYARFFSLEETSPLTGLPEPSAIFISSAPYRRLYELMQEWFAAGEPAFSDVRSLIEVSKSSRIYEHYVLALLVDALGEPVSRRRVTYAELAKRQSSSSSVCNEFVFKEDGREVTLLYEPVVPSGLREDMGIGLVRTMTFDFSPQGAPLADPAGAYWTPDYVIRVRDDRGTRYWIADAKYKAWPSFLQNYAQATMAKYLLGTAPRDASETQAGLAIFCGKSHGADDGRRSLRNIDATCARTPVAEIITLYGREVGEAQVVQAWVREMLQGACSIANL